MNTAQLKTYMARCAALVERELEAWLPSDDEPPADLHRAMRYAVLGPGKRLRPILTVAAAEAVGGNARQALPAAMAVELVHNYSLIHDDLPCMDDDDARRGHPTCHVAFGEANALLAGDALLTLAFEVLAVAATQAPPDAVSRLTRAAAEVARAAGWRGMVGGQVLDLAAVGKGSTLDELRVIHARKTGCLFSAAVRAGAILAGAAPDDLAALTIYAENFGLAFQITDDILDWPADRGEPATGGPGPAAAAAPSYPALVGVAESRRLAAEAARAAKDALARFGKRGLPLALLADFVVTRKA